MNRKYEITDIAHTEYPWLHRIRALRDIRDDVHAGDLGGFIESEQNLSMEDSCWLYDGAIVCEKARVAEQSTLRDGAMACGHALVSGDAQLSRGALVTDNAHVAAGVICGLAVIGGNAEIRRDPQNGGNPTIKNDTAVYGVVVGNVEITGFYELRAGEKIVNHSKDVLSLHADEFTGCLMPPRFPKRPREMMKRSDPER